MHDCYCGGRSAYPKQGVRVAESFAAAEFQASHEQSNTVLRKTMYGLAMLAADLQPQHGMDSSI
jgi:hypothetical protein